MKKLVLTMVVVMFGIAFVFPVAAGEHEHPEKWHVMEHSGKKPEMKHTETEPAMKHGEKAPDMKHPEKGHEMEYSEKKSDMKHPEKEHAMKHGEKAPDMKHPEKGHEMEHSGKKPDMKHPKTEPAMKHGEKTPDMKHPEKEHGMDHSGHKGMMIREVTVDGHGFAYHLIDMRAHVKNMPTMAATHHLMVYIKSPDGDNFEKGKVGFLIQNPDGSKQKVMAMGMSGGFGADVSFKKKGRYIINIKVVAGKKIMKDKFLYEVK